MNNSQFVFLLTPPVLLATTRVAFRMLVSQFGIRRGYLAGFAFYWIAWCLFLPIGLIGLHGVEKLFVRGTWGSAELRAIGILFLILPLFLGYGYAFPKAIRHTNAAIVLFSAVLALTNATFEELLWRGAYLKVFPGDWLFGYAYPSLGFALWHLAPQAIIPNRAPGGRASFVLVSGMVGLL